ncbi:unnamed protein product, partial [Callosobruchus maculatus]
MLCGTPRPTSGSSSRSSATFLHTHALLPLQYNSHDDQFRYRTNQHLDRQQFYPCQNHLGDDKFVVFDPEALCY